MLFDARGCHVGLERVPLDLKDLRGRVGSRTRTFPAQDLHAVMLGEPVQIGLRPETAPDSPFSHVADFRGTTPVASAHVHLQLADARVLRRPRHVARDRGDTGASRAAPVTARSVGPRICAA